MHICNDCIEQVLEVLKDWMCAQYGGGVVMHPGGHWDAEERRHCPGFLFHWGIEDLEEVEEDDE